MYSYADSAWSNDQTHFTASRPSIASQHLTSNTYHLMCTCFQALDHRNVAEIGVVAVPIRFYLPAHYVNETNDSFDSLPLRLSFSFYESTENTVRVCVALGHSTSRSWAQYEILMLPTTSTETMNSV